MAEINSSYTAISTKFEYENEEDKEFVFDLIKNYNSILRFTYNRIYDSKDTLTRKELYNLIKGMNMNNNYLPSQFWNTAIIEAKSIYKLNGENKVIFGGKKLFEERQKGKISKEEFQLRRLRPLSMIGHLKHHYYNSNRYFQIISDNQILFKYSKSKHITINLKLDKNNLEKFKKLRKLQDEGKIALTYYISPFNDISISYEVQKENEYELIKNRILAIDLNPNYIGYSVIDWVNTENGYEYKIIEAQIISLKDLNDKFKEFKEKKLSSTSKEMKWLTNERHYEISLIIKYLINRCIHYKCELFVIEDLNMEGENKGKGRNYNRLINNLWCRNLFENLIFRRCIENNIKLLTLEASFSSFIGNLAFRNEKLPDPILASIEMSRRGYEYKNQYLTKEKLIKKNIIFDNSEFNLSRISQSLEELGYKMEFKDIKDLYNKIKNLDIRYRFPLNLDSEVFTQISNKLYFKIYKFI